MSTRRPKRRGSQAVRGSAPLPAWLWLLSGVALGVGLSAAFIVLDLAPGRSAGSETPVANVQAEAPLAQEPEAQNPARRPTPRYTFYTVLPEMEVVIPDAELSNRRRSEPPPSQDAPTPEVAGVRYLLQAGSFRDPRDADAVQAKLILLNFSPHVQTVTIDSTTWHRVRLGPFTSARDVDEAKRTLEANGIQAITLRESGG